MNPRLALFALPLVFACHATTEVEEHVSAPPTEVAASVPADLEELLRSYHELTGWSITYDDSTQATLASIAVSRVGPADLGVLRIGPVAAPGTSQAPRQIEVIALRYADVNQLARTLTNVIGGPARGAEPRTGIATDERTNSLIVHGSEEQLVQLKKLIARLDVEVGG